MNKVTYTDVAFTDHWELVWRKLAKKPLIPLQAYAYIEFIGIAQGEPVLAYYKNGFNYSMIKEFELEMEEI